jgi:hypothetical protein
MASLSEQSLAASVRRWRALTILIGVSQIILLASGFASKTEKAVTAEKFVLVDAEGTTVAELMRVGKEPRLVFTSPSDSALGYRATLGMIDGHPILDFVDPEGTSLASLRGGTAASPSDGALVLRSSKSKEDVMVCSGKEGAGIILFSESGELRSAYRVSGEVARIDFLDNEVTTRASLGFTPKSTESAAGSFLALSDAYGKVRASIAELDNKSFVLLKDASGKVIFGAP